ncbi:MAG: hypothetical protein R2813_01170 [Flavobacteriales bacterium]
MNSIRSFLANEDALNIVLIIVSLVLAFLMPFSLFLFSYAILGPLHYLTEINWLNEKKYFVRQSMWIWLFVIGAAIVSFPAFAHLPFFNLESQSSLIRTIVYGITDYYDILLVTLVLFAASLVFLKKPWHLFVALPLSLIIGKVIVQYVLGSFIVVGIFLPTIVHVYVFTLLFMLYGALSSRKREAFIGTALLLISPVIILLVSINPDFYGLTETEQAVGTVQNFRFVNFIAELFDSTENGRIVAFSSIGLKIQTFIAFCYTYHYLNWFSKTTTIGWRKNLSTRRSIAILAAWAGSIGLFLYDYEIAYLALFFLAILHIVLEFPLNVVSMRGIVQKLFS